MFFAPVPSAVPNAYQPNAKIVSRRKCHTGVIRGETIRIQNPRHSRSRPNLHKTPAIVLFIHDLSFWSKFTMSIRPTAIVITANESWISHRGSARMRSEQQEPIQINVSSTV